VLASPALRSGALLLAGGGGVAWATRPPTVYLAAGVHRGPIVIDRTETLVGEPGAVVRGGIVVRADDVTVRDVTVKGGDDGIQVENARRVLLDGVHVVGARLDGIHVRRSNVMIEDCTIERPRSRYAQGIDISFSFDLPMSMVEGCTVRGGQEGIVADFAQVEFRQNRVVGTTLRGITLNEMSMGMVEQNEIRDALGVGILCSDQSECEVERNVVQGLRPDLATADRSRRGYGVVAFYGATATIADNHLAGAPLQAGSFADGHIQRSS
jgi:nitrous oxidase accessory protein NosD